MNVQGGSERDDVYLEMQLQAKDEYIQNLQDKLL